jgi:hypothetical protein
VALLPLRPVDESTFRRLPRGAVGHHREVSTCSCARRTQPRALERHARERRSAASFSALFQQRSAVAAVARCLMTSVRTLRGGGEQCHRCDRSFADGRCRARCGRSPKRRPCSSLRLIPLEQLILTSEYKVAAQPPLTRSFSHAAQHPGGDTANDTLAIRVGSTQLFRARSPVVGCVAACKYMQALHCRGALRRNRSVPFAHSRPEASLSAVR